MYTQYHTTSTFKIWGFKSTFASIYTHNTRIFANFDATMTLRGSWLLQFPRSLASKAWYTKPGWSLKMESLPAIFFESNKIGRDEVATKIPTSHDIYPSFEESNLRPGPTSSTPYAGIWDTSQPISACGWRWRCGFPTGVVVDFLTWNINGNMDWFIQKQQHTFWIDAQFGSQTAP